MKTLTLEHLAPYLPYGLETIHGLIRKKITAISLDSPFLFCTTYLGSRQKQMLHIQEIKPILRPLSDLTKIENLEYKYLGKLNFANAFEVDEKPCGIMALPHYFYVWLLSGHYDVFGFIEQGLAIDINTLEK